MLEMPGNLAETNESLMSNFDHVIDESVAEELKGGNCWAKYTGWEFYGKVWYVEAQYHCEIWRYGSHVSTISEDTPQELMDAVCSHWGSE